GLGNNADGSLRAPAYDAFIGKYLTAGGGTPSPYANDLIAYLDQLTPGSAPLTAAQALAQFQLLSRPLQLPFLSQVLTDELNATGLAHTQQGLSYDRGYDAIHTLFPQKSAHGDPLTYQGDINLFFSQLKTEQGGDIDLLAPGGAVVVGVPNPPQELNDVKGQLNLKPPISAEANLGLLVLASGRIQGFANGDFDVNQARILTLQGGDIILWSSFGSIDAGKGAKTAQGAPPPVIETDPNGNVFVNPVGAVSGSGIGQLLTVVGIKPGLVDLIAPTGVVNAGEAGIRVAGNLNIAATAVLNVGNIKVGGTATGVPTSDAGALSGALSGANALGDAGKAVAEQLNQGLNAGNNYQQLTDSLTPAFIVVRMFCLGVQCDTQ
ncbi:MAG: filamentous hemagglutinin family protein, partial [Gammaproteobacteria bacterium]|nr:filamentous hemagglutinin family protein [Gammaproteobacteria bacterium]